MNQHAPARPWGWPRALLGLLTLVAVLLVPLRSRDRGAAFGRAPEGDSKQVTPRFPLGIDPAKSRAYAYAVDGKPCLRIFLVGESNVVEAIFALPGKSEDSRNFTIPRGKEESIVLHRGPNIARYVLPAGAVQPRPDTPEFSKAPGRSGRVVCKNPPRELGDQETEFTVSFDALDFGDGSHTSSTRSR